MLPAPEKSTFFFSNTNPNFAIHFEKEGKIKSTFQSFVGTYLVSKWLPHKIWDPEGPQVQLLLNAPYYTRPWCEIQLFNIPLQIIGLVLDFRHFWESCLRTTFWNEKHDYYFCEVYLLRSLFENITITRWKYISQDRKKKIEIQNKFSPLEAISDTSLKNCSHQPTGVFTI